MLRQYCLILCCDTLAFLRRDHGADWPEKLRSGNTVTAEDVEAIRDILWRASVNNWFEYPFGSRLIFFCFPARYRSQAKRGVKVRGVKVMFTCKGPSSKRRQPLLKADKKEVL
jgi:hypothetical protein